ncbi:MAG TPA: hypothetical protein PKG54_06095 [Phycisphaerae bacterium]|jgi:hypothetical protein|nr:hypothetical protein [Phycisphaerae bacterium]HOB74081.1 hypothetical protein [Phycisphaerae bacterium]HOJ56753.1 hypothetical protein [Phycisphaerae bacterium]HOL25393.1 hypothetical protein [Phycisphaerae bacterium]HPP22069.1 hypothetical protein [Phycisphaerae bacterium]
MTRRVLIVLLAGLNLFLLACLVFTAYSPPSAFAQALPRAGDYLMIAAQTEADNDVLYLIDSKARRIYAFRTTYPRMPGTPFRFVALAQRDLSADFRRER